VKVFVHYARYYDLLYRDKDYRGEADFIISTLRRHAPGAKRILELGCGTGIHAQMMAAEGYEIEGIDLSETMLNAARSRLSTLPVDLQRRLRFAQGDVRSYRTAEKFDVVLSLFHVFSYQVSNSDLSAAFATAHEHLNTGGSLIFDYWYGPAVLSQRPETRVKRLRDDELSIVRIAEPRMDDMRNLVEVNYETIVRGSETMEIIRESHPLRYLFIPEIELLAKMNGFECETHLEWMADSRPSVKSWAAFSVLTKI